MNRLFDLVIAAFLFAVLFPFLITLALILRILQGPPVLFSEERVGRGEEPSAILKFRMMKLNNLGHSVATSKDDRLTPAGRILKRARIDEWPQLYNVLRGEMSLVGPRPHPPAHVASLEKELAARLLSVTPGLTEPAALDFLAEDEILARFDDPETVYVNVLLPVKARAQLEYIEKRSLLADLGILFSTMLSTWSPGAWKHSRAMLLAICERRSSA